MVPTVLLVEDNTDDELLACRTFNRIGCHAQLQVARDGIEALEYLKANEPPVLVLLDLKMPRMSGLELLEHLRSNWVYRQIPVVVLTSSDETTDIEQCYGLGANSFVRKPVDYVQYTEAFTKIVEYWLSLNCVPVAGCPAA